MYLAIPGVYRAKWSKDIHEEWMSNLLINRPDLTRAQLERTRELMDKNAPDALVTGYESLIPSLSLPDEGDRHVLAAATQFNSRGRKSMPKSEESTHSLGSHSQHVLRLVWDTQDHSGGSMNGTDDLLSRPERFLPQVPGRKSFRPG